ncbi:MAG: hypothetical protein WC045_02630 [Patescibacteria group bacterium]
MLTPSWDLFISIFFIVAVVFGIALGRERAVAGIVSSFIGLVVANVGGNYLMNYMSGNQTTHIGNTLEIATNTQPFFVKTALFAVIALLLTVKGDFFKNASTAHDGFGSIILGALYSFLNAGFIINAIVTFMQDAGRTELLEQSHLISQVIQYQVWWFVLPAILMIFLGFRKKPE